MSPSETRSLRNQPDMHRSPPVQGTAQSVIEDWGVLEKYHPVR